MLPLFIMKFKNYRGKVGWWETFFPQVKGHFGVKLNFFFKCFGKHILVPIREAVIFGVRFDIQVQGFVGESGRFVTFDDKQFKVLSRGYL